MFLAGTGIPVMAALNGALGSRIGAPAAAAILFSVGLVCALLAVAGTGGIETARILTALARPVPGRRVPGIRGRVCSVPDQGKLRPGTP
jgi:uncharacterized membrane protein YdcZ (DUF606 family)